MTTDAKTPGLASVPPAPQPSFKAKELPGSRASAGRKGSVCWSHLQTPVSRRLLVGQVSSVSRPVLGMCILGYLNMWLLCAISHFSNTIY